MKNSIINEQERLVLDGAIRRALDILYKTDFYLIENQLHEQCIAFRFGGYLLEELKHTIYSEYDLDAEYNKNMDRKNGLNRGQKEHDPTSSYIKGVIILLPIFLL